MHKRVEKWIAGGKLLVTGSCWEWVGCLNSDGYPKVSWKGSANGKGHRIVYSLLHPDEDITGKVIRHTCDNPRCLRPDHLVSGTPSDNMRDRGRRGRTYRHVSGQETAEVRSLRDAGMSYKCIAETLGCTYKRVEYILTVKSAKQAGG